MDYRGLTYIGNLEIETPNNRCKEAVSIRKKTGEKQKGNYEARMQVYSGKKVKDEKKYIEDFFNNFNQDNHYKFDKDNIKKYLELFEFEFEYQIMNNYNEKIPSGYRQAQLDKLNDFTKNDFEFNLDNHIYDSQKRYFIGSKSKIFSEFKGYVLLPEISSIYIKKYEDEKNKFIYIFEIWVNSSLEKEVNNIKTAYELVPNKIGKMANSIAEIKSIDFEKKFTIENLNFEKEVKEDIERRITKNLKMGKHIILSGPPGTGKSKLAKQICEFYETNYKLTTAIADWSTYETIGGYNVNKDGILDFNAGVFLSCFKDKEKNNINKWLIVDEMNRADIDKAFGTFFSILAGDDVELNYKNNKEENIKVLNEQNINNGSLNDEDYIIPKDWRLIGSINTLDKASLFEMSYAFMRRFAIIPISIPTNIDINLVESYLSIWNIPSVEIGSLKLVDGLLDIWLIINKYRPIGPAILKDIAMYVENEEDWTSILIMYVLPQFEGSDDDELKDFIADLLRSKVKVDEIRINAFVKEFFGSQL
ncbi:MAG: AAA family ATPase [Sarcina sp.]